MRICWKGNGLCFRFQLTVEAACRGAAVEVIFSRMGVKCDENWHIKAPFPFCKSVRGKDGGIRRPCPRCRFRRSHLLPLPPAVRQYFISSVGIAAQVADFEACAGVRAKCGFYTPEAGSPVLASTPVSAKRRWRMGDVIFFCCFGKAV